MIQKKVEALALKLPFRPGVGMMIINQNNRIFVGKRIDSKTNGWQMPQGGINLGETPSAAALREMAEEIGSSQGKIIAESKKWYSYRLPPFLVHKLWGGKYCGQRQKWFLIRFTGQDSDINVKTKHPEFDSWQWVGFNELLENIIPFKYKLYSKIIAEFKEFINTED